MFAAVMRKAGVPKQLECHGFVCDSPEEAILVAANLYQALLETMKRNKRPNSSSQVRRAPVSELYLGVTTAVPTLWCLGPIVWSRVKAASFLIVVDCFSFVCSFPLFGLEVLVPSFGWLWVLWLFFVVVSIVWFGVAHCCHLWCFECCFSDGPHSALIPESAC